MKRERHWIEVTIINSGVRQCIDANKIEGEPASHAADGPQWAALDAGPP